MKNIKYIFILIFLVISNTKMVGMQFKDNADQIYEVGRHADISRAKNLLSEGMDVNARGLLGYTMLLHSISYLHETEANAIPAEKRLEFMNFLLKKGAKLHPNTECWQEVPMLAATSSKIGPQIIVLLKKHGACVNFSHPDNGMTPLHLASWNGRLDVVSCLLKEDDIVINSIDNEGKTPLN